MNEWRSRKLESFANQCLLDRFDVSFLQLDNDVFEVRQGDAWIGVLRASGSRWRATLAHAALTREDSAIRFFGPTLDASTFAIQDIADARDRIGYCAQPRDLSGAAVTDGVRPRVKLHHT